MRPMEEKENGGKRNLRLRVAAGRQADIGFADVAGRRIEQGSGYPVTGKVMPMAVSPDRRFLFAALRTEPYSIASFAIDGANGMLTHLGNAPAPNSAPYISTDRTGRFLFGAYNPESEELAAAPGGSASARSVRTGTCTRRTR
jgi:hypothetical protein